MSLLPQVLTNLGKKYYLLCFHIFFSPRIKTILPETCDSTSSLEMFVKKNRNNYKNNRKDCNLIVVLFVLHVEFSTFLLKWDMNFSGMHFNNAMAKCDRGFSFVWFIIIAFPPLTEFLCHFVSMFAFLNRLDSIRCMQKSSRSCSVLTVLGLFFGWDGWKKTAYEKKGVKERRFILWFIQTE